MAGKSKSQIAASTMRGRAGLRKAQMADELRSRLDGVKCINAIEEADDELKLMGQGLRKRKSKIMAPEEKALVDSRLKILAQRVDINFRKLAKVMPDLRALALTDSEGRDVNYLEEFAKAVMGRDRDAKSD